MTPLTVTADLLTPPILDRPVYLDGIVLSGVGESMGAAHPSGWVDPATVEAAPLPLARVDTHYGWWYAASHVLPFGPEQGSHLNRVPAVEEMARWTTARSLTHGSGPDKRLRVPYYYRPGMLSLTWTCVGEPAEVARLLAYVPSIGRMTGHGHGWVSRWTVAPGGPEAAAYASDLTLRHLPVDMRVEFGPRVVRRHMPLRPPYHARRNSQPCWQVQP